MSSFQLSPPPSREPHSHPLGTLSLLLYSHDLSVRNCQLLSRFIKLVPSPLCDTVLYDTICYNIAIIWSRAEKDRASHDGRPVWMRSLLTTASEWLSMVPKSLEVLRRTADNIKDPLFRFFEREVSIRKNYCTITLVFGD